MADLTEAKPRWSAEDKAKKADDKARTGYPKDTAKAYEKAPRKTYDKPASDRPAYEKPAYDRHASDRPAYEKPAYAKPAYEKSDKPAYGAKPAYAKPAAAARDDAPRKTWTPLPTDGAPKEARTPYAGKADGARKPFVRRTEGDAKPYGAKSYGDAPRKPYGEAKEGFKPRSAGFKSQGGAEGGPARASGYKSHAAGSDAAKPARAPYGDKPRSYEARPRVEGDSRPAQPYAAKPYGAKSFGDRPMKSGPARSGGFKSHGTGDAPKSYAKPASARVEAGDTSRRFVPPRKPKE